MPVAAAADPVATQRERFERLPAPDYSTDDGWLRRRHPGGGVQDPAVFYVHPTTVRTLEAWFAAHRDAATLAGTRAVVDQHGPAFPGNMWAPAYRQATTRAFHQHDRGGEQAYDLAFEDVRRAFMAFLHEVPDGPIVLAGHSQGARHIVSILAALAAGELPGADGIASRVVAAYAIGIGIPARPDVLQRFPLPVTREETGVLVGWNAVLDETGPRAAPSQAPRGAVDPISFSAVGADRIGAVHQGGAFPPFDGMRVAAQCDGDIVRIRQLKGDDLSLYALPGGGLHAVELQLFSRDIRDDLRRRTRVWRENHQRRSIR